MSRLGVRLRRLMKLTRPKQTSTASSMKAVRPSLAPPKKGEVSIKEKEQAHGQK